MAKTLNTETKPQQTALNINIQAQEMRLLLGLSDMSLSRLAAQGLLERAGHGEYVLASVGKYIRHLRAKPKKNQGQERLTDAKARVAEVEADQAEGNVVGLAEFQQTLDDLTTLIRQRFLALPHRATPLVLGETDAGVVYKVLEGLVYETLDGLADTEVAEPDEDIGGSSEGGVSEAEAPAEPIDSNVVG